MIGIDTNVLLRAMTGDHEAQAARARQLLNQAAAIGTRIFINHVVLYEFVWVLDRRMRLGRDGIADAIQAVLMAAEFEIAERSAVVEALRLYRVEQAGFAEILIGIINRVLGCDVTYTFDRAASEGSHFRSVPTA
jgi:predicted nucleic-acid-binding protein